MTAPDLSPAGLAEWCRQMARYREVFGVTYNANHLNALARIVQAVADVEGDAVEAVMRIRNGMTRDEDARVIIATALAARGLAADARVEAMREACAKRLEEWAEWTETEGNWPTDGSLAGHLMPEAVQAIRNLPLGELT